MKKKFKKGRGYVVVWYYQRSEPFWFLVLTIFQQVYTSHSVFAIVYFRPYTNTYVKVEMTLESLSSNYSLQLGWKKYILYQSII